MEHLLPDLHALTHLIVTTTFQGRHCGMSLLLFVYVVTRPRSHHWYVSNLRLGCGQSDFRVCTLHPQTQRHQFTSLGHIKTVGFGKETLTSYVHAQRKQLSPESKCLQTKTRTCVARHISRTTAVATHWWTTTTCATFPTFQSLKNYWFIMISKSIAWTFSFHLLDQHRNSLTLTHMPVHSCIYSVNTIQGWENARLGARWRDIWLHEPCSWHQGAHTLMGKIGQKQAQRRGNCPSELGLATAQSAETITAWFRYYLCPPGARNPEGEANA